MSALAAIAAAVLLGAAPASGQRTETLADPASKDEVVLQLVDRSGAPVRDAEVRWAFEDERDGLVEDPAQPGGRRQALRLGTAPLASAVDGHLARVAPVALGRSDGAGRVRARWPRGRALLVAASRDELWGFRWLARDGRTPEGAEIPRDAPIRVELAPDWELVVRVDAPGGRPAAGVPLRVSYPGRSLGLSSDADGLARIAHVGFELRDATEPLVASVEALLDPPVTASVAPGSRPSGPLVMNLPETGAVEVVLGPHDTSKRPRIASLRLASAGARPEARFDRAEPGGVRAPIIEGKARFAYVALGRDLEARVDGSGPWTRFRGPTWAGETATLTTTREPEPPLAPEESLPPIAAPAVEVEVEGRVVLDPGIPADELEIRIRGTGRDGDWQSGPFVQGSTFTFKLSHVGPATLEIVEKSMRLLPEPERPVLFRADLQLAPGATSDPRLASIDLRGKLFRHELVLGGVAQRRGFHARVFFRPAGRHVPVQAFARFFQPPLVLVTTWERIDVEVFAPPYRMLELHGVSGRVEAPFEPGLPVRLRLVTDGVLPAPPRYVKALLVPDDGLAQPHRAFDWEGPAFGPSRELVTTAWKPGRTRIQWIAAEKSEAGWGGRGVTPDIAPVQYVEILDTPSEQAFDVSISSAELERLLRAAE